MNLREHKDVINGLKAPAETPIKIRYIDPMNVTQTVDLIDVIEEVSHGPDPRRQIILSTGSGS